MKTIFVVLALIAVLIQLAFAIECYEGEQFPPLEGQTTGLDLTQCSLLQTKCSAYTNDGVRYYGCDSATCEAAKDKGRIICCGESRCNVDKYSSAATTVPAFALVAMALAAIAGLF